MIGPVYDEKRLLAALEPHVPAKFKNVAIEVMEAFVAPGGLLARLPQDTLEMEIAKSAIVAGMTSVVAACVYEHFAPDNLEPHIEPVLIQPILNEMRPQLNKLFPESDLSDMANILQSLVTLTRQTLDSRLPPRR